MTHIKNSSTTDQSKLQDSFFEVTLKKIQSREKRDVVYLTSPYNNNNQNFRIHRFLELCKIANKLVSDKNMVVFCPVLNYHSISNLGRKDSQDDTKVWFLLNNRVIKCCDYLLVLMLSGWPGDADVRSDIILAEYHNKPIKFIDPITLDITDTPK